MEIEELVKLLIFVLVLVIVVTAVIVLLKGRGGELLDSVRRIMRFGR